MRSITLVLFPSLASSFVLIPRVGTLQQHPRCYQSSDPNSDNTEESTGGLKLDGLDQEMSKMSSKFSFSESDYLAAARKRAEMKAESSNAGASDDDWKQVADEKAEKYGNIDDWENSMKEAGNSDSQILMFTDPPVEGDEDGEGGEPKLMLF